MAPALSDTELISRMKGAFFGSVVADALSLGTHYEYDAQKIRQFYGDIDRYYAPGERTGGETHGIGWGGRNFHSGNASGTKGWGGPAKKAGECTDYGDYNILMLEHLAATASPPHRVKLDELVPFWMKALPKWRSWLCTQTKQTYQQASGAAPKLPATLGGMSNAMALRSAAAYGYFDSEEDVVHAARTMMFTHREETALDGGEFFARVAFRVIHGPMGPREAIQAVASESSPFIRDKVKQAIDKVAEATDPKSPLSKEAFADDLAITSMARLWDVGKSEPIKVGKASPTEGVLPGSIYFILKYEDLYEAARANAMVGGDNASRAVAIGMVLGAVQGLEGVPPRLRDTFVDWQRLEGLLETLPLIRQRMSSAAMDTSSAVPEPSAAAAVADIEEGFVDISEEKDGGLLKKILVEGTGEDRPPAGSSVDVHYVGTLHSDGSKFDSSRDRPGKFTFDVGVGQVIMGWDEGILTMKRGEKCILRCSSDYAYGDEGSPPKIPGGATLNFEVELFTWKEKVQPPSRMTADERAAHALKMKELGTEAFKLQDFAGAVNRYADGVEYITFCGDDGSDDDDDHGHSHGHSHGDEPCSGHGEKPDKAEPAELSDEAKQLAVALLNNCAMARMKIGEVEPAIQDCNRALEYDEKNVKALFRRAECELKTGGYADAKASCEKVFEVDPGNKAAEALKVKVAREEAAAKKKEKAMYSKMFG